MTSRSVYFCNNIKAYHNKRGEEQFYDFTIKDKHGEEITSHKFILASQSKYFAALFRIDPTSNETTFKDFPIDVIKVCIEYLYVLEVNLTGSNIQDVMMFADYITLTDVIDICTDYIIKNIDRSNYANVINLGNSCGMYKLVEAGASFAVRNLTQGKRVSMGLITVNPQMIKKITANRRKRNVFTVNHQNCQQILAVKYLRYPLLRTK